jgi:hypothetical protein
MAHRIMGEAATRSGEVSEQAQIGCFVYLGHIQGLYLTAPSQG